MDTLTVYAPGHFDWYDSYGLIACQLVRHLSQAGVYVNAVGLGETVRDNQPEDVRALTTRPIRPALGGILLGYPTTWPRHGPLVAHGPRVAVTMFESTRLPPGWVEGLNTCDAVIVPSTFCREVFTSCGVSVPVHVIPLGISEVYQPRARRVREPFTFLTFGDRGRRKGGVWALQAFLLAFGDDPAYRLIIKTRTPKVGMEITNPNIDLLQRDMTEEELYRLYLSADCMVFPTMGEGFGLPPREMACSGGIVLATDWGGTADHLDEWGFPLPYRLVKADWKGASNLEGLDLGEWAEPDVQGVARAMRHVADNRIYYRREAYNSAFLVRRRYSWETFAAGVLDVWKEVVDGIGNRARALAS